MEPGPTASSYPKWPAGTPRGVRAPRKEQFRAAAHLAENGSVSVLPTSNAHISLKSAFRDPRFSIEAESCLDLANGAKKNFRIFFGKNRNFLIRKTCFSCFSCFLLFSYLKNERKIFRIFELFAQISRLLPSPVSMISRPFHTLKLRVHFSHLMRPGMHQKCL